jgi:hypothetical protein
MGVAVRTAWTTLASGGGSWGRLEGKAGRANVRMREQARTGAARTFNFMIDS